MLTSLLYLYTSDIQDQIKNITGPAAAETGIQTTAKLINLAKLTNYISMTSTCVAVRWKE